MKIVILILIASLSFANSYGQVRETKHYDVGFFAPVYLDSAFAGTYYRYGKNFPKFTLGGLEFFQGAQVALDTLRIPETEIKAHLFDTKSVNLDALISGGMFDSLQLIIGSVRENDYSTLARYALKRNIPFISVTYPNDGGITGNPFLVIVNSTLRAHCEAIYGYILQNHGTENIIICKKPGLQEDKVLAYFQDINKPDGSPLLKMQVITIENDYEILKSKLDSTRQNIIVGGSLDEVFATDLAKAANGWSATYPLKVIGMPNWESFFDKPDAKLKNFPVYFTSPYYNIQADSYSSTLKNIYQKKYKISPSDMAYKGFESVYVFIKLLERHPNDFMNHLNEYPHKVFTDFNFKPVFLNERSGVPDYFENKHLYFIKAENGSFSAAW